MLLLFPSFLLSFLPGSRNCYFRDVGIFISSTLEFHFWDVGTPMPDAGIFFPDAGISFYGHWNFIFRTLEFNFRNAGIKFPERWNFFLSGRRNFRSGRWNLISGTMEFKFRTLEFQFRSAGNYRTLELAHTGISFPGRNYRTLEF